VLRDITLSFQENAWLGPHTRPRLLSSIRFTINSSWSTYSWCHIPGCW